MTIPLIKKNDEDNAIDDFIENVDESEEEEENDGQITDPTLFATCGKHNS